MRVFELNLDGLVGPTHHYAGLSPGNIASTSNARTIANPAAAALQGIAKMRLLHQMGLKQAVLPPQPRPNLQMLQLLGFSGSPSHMLENVYKDAPILLSASYSASSMWAANAATVCPSSDAADHRVHFTPANLISNLHRHQETHFTSLLLKTIFADERYFQHHPALPSTAITSDEGAANHNRVCADHSSQGIHLFVYGKQGLTPNVREPSPQEFPARQTLEASHAIARSHQINSAKVIYACQNPAVIDQGVFHNDVISVANESVFMFHQHAFLRQAEVLQELKDKADFPLCLLEVTNQRVDVKEAVQSYLFNSQLITIPHQPHSMVLIAPTECLELPKIKNLLDDFIQDSANPITNVHYMDLKQSMRNGGGPACLRLRVCLNEDEFSAMHQGVVINDDLLVTLEQWVRRHYRTELHINDLVDPNLISETHFALDELTAILKLGSIYPFQQS